MKSFVGLLCAVVAMLVLSAAVGHKGQTTAPGDQAELRAADGQRTPVVVELFTSEGCSSCPPADALLAWLERTQPVPGADIIALEEHVDYWNHLGWRDPYSSPELTARQSAYAQVFGSDSVYTPQMVVDGQAGFVGSHKSRARQAIARAAAIRKAAVHLAWARNAAAGNAVPLEIRIERLGVVAPGDTAEVFLAITEDNLRSDVTRGENTGRKLEHVGVVRELKRIGKADPQAATAFAAQPRVTMAREWKRENVRGVVFVQESRSRRILAAATIPVPSQ